MRWRSSERSLPNCNPSRAIIVDICLLYSPQYFTTRGRVLPSRLIALYIFLKLLYYCLIMTNITPAWRSIRFLFVIIAAGSALLGNAPARAQDNCKDVLEQQELVLKNHKEVRLSYLLSIDEQTYRRIREGSAGSYLGVITGSQSYEDFRASLRKQVEQLNKTESELLEIRRMYVTDLQVEQWGKCIAMHSFGIQLDRSVNGFEVVISGRWIAPPGITGAQITDFDIPEGFERISKSVVGRKFEGNGEFTVRLKRTSDAGGDVSVSINPIVEGRNGPVVSDSSFTRVINIPQIIRDLPKQRVTFWVITDCSYQLRFPGNQAYVTTSDGTVHRDAVDQISYTSPNPLKQDSAISYTIEVDGKASQIQINVQVIQPSGTLHFRWSNTGPDVAAIAGPMTGNDDPKKVFLNIEG